MGQSSKVTSKYQITIPKEIRKQYEIKAGDILVFEREEIGLKIEKLEEFQKKYFGMFAGRGGHSVRDIHEARKHMARDFKWKKST